jgi:membrane protein required for colicin V production
MHYIDLILIIPILWGLYRGFMNGVIMEAATLAAFFLGAWGGIYFSDFMAGLIKSWSGSNSPYIPLIAFAVTFVGILALVFVTAKLVQRFVENGIALGLVNKLAGAAFGAMKFAMILSLLLFVIDSIGKEKPLIPKSVTEKSLLYKPVASIAPALIPGLSSSRLAHAIPSKDSLSLDLHITPKGDSVNVTPELKIKPKKDSAPAPQKLIPVTEPKQVAPKKPAGSTTKTSSSTSSSKTSSTKSGAKTSTGKTSSSKTSSAKPKTSTGKTSSSKTTTKKTAH